MPSRAQENTTTVADRYSQVSIASPTAASLGKYADIPVNYHTGIPAISIPIYTIQEGPLTLPLSLSYHAGGIKVMEPASWVGTGWALNAGGVITRTVMGAPDEAGASNAVYGHFSHYGYSSYWTEGNADVIDNKPSPNAYNFKIGQFDGEPDLFFFNFNGYTGKFFFSDDRTPVLVDGNDLKIEYYYPRGQASTYTAESSNIQGFIITVPTGDKYYFGITDDQPLTGARPIEIVTPLGEAASSNDRSFSSYYLNKIVAADRVHTIHFTYQTEKYSYYTIGTFPTASSATLGEMYPQTHRLVCNQTEGVRLAQISFSTGTVDFTPSTTARKDLIGYFGLSGAGDEVNTEAKALDRIAVSAAGFCKQFAFAYGYFEGDNSPLSAGLRGPGFGSNTIQSDKSRLRLNSVSESSCDGTTKANPWSFAYYSNFLPRRLSLAQDHWGFYNGQDANNSLNTLIPTFLVTGNGQYKEVRGANRDAAWPAMGNGMLTKITYPTGGSRALEYEPNDVWVESTQFDFQKVAETSVGRGIGHPSPQPPITLSANTSNEYRFKLDFFSRNWPFATGSASFASLTVSPDPSSRRREVVRRLSTGVHQFSLSVFGEGSEDYAQAVIEEGKFRTYKRNELAGGVRVKAITATAGAATPAIVTTYSYRYAGSDPEGSHSTATLYSRPRYVQVVRNDILAKYGYYGNVQTPHLEVSGCLGPDYITDGTRRPNKQVFLVSPAAILPMATTQGNHIGYDRVTVVQAGSGRTEHNYNGSTATKSYDDVCYRRVDDSFCDVKLPSMPAPPLPYDFARGKVVFERVFDQAGQPLKVLQYAYQYDSSRLVTPAFLVKDVAAATLATFYERKAYWQTQMQVIETNLAAGSQLQTTKVYRYDSPQHRQLTASSVTASTGDVLKTKNSYVFDVRVAAAASLDDGVAAYTSACAACDAVMQQTQASCGSDAVCKRLSYTNNNRCRGTPARITLPTAGLISPIRSIIIKRPTTRPRATPMASCSRCSNYRTTTRMRWSKPASGKMSSC